MITNKNGSTEWTVAKLTSIILLVVLLVLIIYGISTGMMTPLKERVVGYFDNVMNTIYSWGGWEWDSSEKPEEVKEDNFKKLQEEQQKVSNEEKKLYSTNKYPIIRLIYGGEFDLGRDVFLVRWNRNLKRTQFLIAINGYLKTPESDNPIKLESGELVWPGEIEWIINPNLAETPKYDFYRGGCVDKDEKFEIEAIASSEDEDEMIAKIAEVTKDEEMQIDFPGFLSIQVLLEGAGKRGQKDEMTAEEIKKKLFGYYPTFYEGEVEKMDVSNELKLIIGDDRTSLNPLDWVRTSWADDEEIFIRWNFEKEKPEVKVRPSGEEIFVGSENKEVWLSGNVAVFLTTWGKEDYLINTKERPGLDFIEGLFVASKPSELSLKINEVLQKQGIENKYWIWAEVNGKKNDFLSTKSINNIMYGLNVDYKGIDKLLGFGDE